MLVFPFDYHLPHFPPEKFKNKFSRKAVRAFINFHKCMFFAIEMGNGDFQDLMPGLTISYLTFALLVGRTPTIMNDAVINIHGTFQPKSITFDSYAQEIDRSVRGTFRGNFHTKLFIYLNFFF